MADIKKYSLQAIAEEAANWFIRFEENDVPGVEREAFVNWLKRSPIHVEEFIRVSATHAQIKGIPVTELISVKELLDQARSNVIDLTHTRVNHTADMGADSSTLTRWARHPGAKAAMLAALTLLAVWLFAWNRTSDDPNRLTYVTALGEQRSILLEDGSVIKLNTQSSLDVYFSEAARSVKLSAGEAVFYVAKDATRPFQVEAGAAVVKAIGTRFNVYRQASQTVITVMEGRVAVSSAKTLPVSATSSGPSAVKPFAAESVELNQDSQITVLETGAIVAPAIVDPEAITAWTDRRLVFNAEPLETVVRELNRYNPKKLVFGDQLLSQQTISGVFDANDPEALLAFLQTVGKLHVEVDSGSGDWILYAEPEIPQPP